MKSLPQQISLEQWDRRYEQLCRDGMIEPPYGGPLRRHIADGDTRLSKLRFDNSAAALRLWNFLLTEEERLFTARANGKKIVGVMKDLGTVPVLAYALDDVVAFYLDGAWWIPCIMEMSAGLLETADALGLNESFCPVRALLGAFLAEGHFPQPDLLTCSVGAVCDDLSAIAQKLNGLGYPILWWEVPHRHGGDQVEESIELPGGFRTTQRQIELVRTELKRVVKHLEQLTGQELTDQKIAAGIEKTNRVRRCLRELREKVFMAELCPMPALEMLIAEMLAIHFCSDQDETIRVLEDLLQEVDHRIKHHQGILAKEAVRVFWVNPVADLRMMNVLEECGGRICGTEYLFSHALDEIPTALEPMAALARMALADPMVGSSAERAARVCRDMRKFQSEALLISRIPGASHCAVEGEIIGEIVRRELDVAVVEIEVPPLADSLQPTLRSRIEALTETVLERRKL